MGTSTGTRTRIASDVCAGREVAFKAQIELLCGAAGSHVRLTSVRVALRARPVVDLDRAIPLFGQWLWEGMRVCVCVCVCVCVLENNIDVHVVVFRHARAPISRRKHSFAGARRTAAHSSNIRRKFRSQCQFPSFSA
jgi:hypothetical protein